MPRSARWKNSLGFNSLRAGKCISSQRDPLPQNFIDRFNSLRAGKCISSLSFVRKPTGRLGFNSLRAGKCISSLVRVSCSASESSEFQFPPSGKVHFKDVSGGKWGALVHLFQFPPSGKVHFKWRLALRVWKMKLILFQFPPSGKVHFKWTAGYKSTGSLLGFNSLRAGKCISRHPFFDPDEPWLQIPQNHTRPARRIFFAKIYPTTPRNPDEYWNGRDFLSKVPRKSGVACVLGQF